MIAAKWSRLFPINNVRHLGPVHTTRGNARCVNGALGLLNDTSTDAVCNSLNDAQHCRIPILPTLLQQWPYIKGVQ